MEPHLIAISGSLKGTTFPVTQPEVSIGREATNSICLNEPSVSRRHCVIKRLNEPGLKDGPSFTVIDLESYNGTFVNGLPISDQRLSHGDQISVGDVHFLLVTRAAEAGETAVQFNENDVITRSTIRLHRDEALYLRPEKVLSALPPDARIARDLNALLKISNTIGSIRDLNELQHQLLELMMETLPAERGSILLLDQNNESFISSIGVNRVTGRDNSIKVSRTITNQVLREGVALLSNDLFENGPPSASVEAQVSSLLCVPLAVFEKPLGVIYLETSRVDARFDENDLQLLTAIAVIAAVALENAKHIGVLIDENKRLQEEINLQHRMIGESPRMREVYQFLAKVAPTDSTVMIRGESGTGKELAAQAIHANSERSTKPFVPINCATLTETLLESELFGHERGAFTGAIAQKRGKLEVAEGGTVFLDEVGELTPVIQAKLLRVLQEREFERVGGTRPIKVNVRVIAATNKDLEAAIKAGEFRQDLYYRLNVVSILMPPLRERRPDIPLLANYFAAQFSKSCKRKIAGISPDARKILQSYDWPGNVREMENAIERAVVLGSTSTIEPADLPEAIIESGKEPLPTKYYEAVRQAKKDLIQKTLEDTQGNFTAAARVLGVHPNNLHRLIRTLNLKQGSED